MCASPWSRLLIAWGEVGGERITGATPAAHVGLGAAGGRGLRQKRVESWNRVASTTVCFRFAVPHGRLCRGPGHLRRGGRGLRRRRESSAVFPSLSPGHLNASKILKFVLKTRNNPTHGSTRWSAGSAQRKTPIWEEDKLEDRSGEKPSSSAGAYPAKARSAHRIRQPGPGTFRGLLLFTNISNFKYIQ
jgi:hypothetical protein